MSSLSPALTLWKETRASGEAQDEPPSQEAQDREHAEQAQIGASVVAVLFWLGLAKVVGGLFL